MRLTYSLLLSLSSLLPLGTPAHAESLPEFRFSLNHMDPKVAPEDDFFRYACGTWLKQNKIPGDRASWGPTEFLMEQNASQLRAICEAAAAGADAAGAPKKLVGDFYTSATNEAKINELAWKPLAPDLARIAEIQDLPGLASVIGNFQLHGNAVLFGWYVDADSRASDRYAFQLVQGGTSLPDRDYYLHADFAKELATYSEHLEKMFTLAGDEAAAAKANAATVLRLETALAKVSKSAEDLNDAVENYHKLTSTELAKLTPDFPWEAYWKALGLSPESMVVGQPEYLAAASKLFASEPLADWKTYLRWHLITSAASELHQAVDAENFAFFGKVLEGKKEQSLRWKRAVKATDDAMGDALGQLYVAKHFPPAAKQRMETMVANIKAVYADHIRQAAWMSETTRQKALVKLEKFRAKLGYPSKWKEYAGLEIKPDDYFGNLQRATLWETKRQLARVGQPVDREEWAMTAPTVNAYFNQNNNEIVFPAGILQPPFFDLTLDDAVNYGSTGAVIGHEMTHGFDSEGRKFNASGNLEDWWTEADAKEFTRRAAILVNDFSARDGVPGMKVNGKLTLPENIADLGGIVLAYEGLQRAIKADPKLGEPIGGFTPQQRYFLSYSQSWMQLAQSALIRKRMASDSHAPDHLRAVAPLQNFQPWYDAFKIPVKSKLYIAPEKRAVIW